MTTREADRIREQFYEISAPSAEEEFRFIEALRFLIEETKQPHYMMELGGYYYGVKKFDLALKYYELAAEYHDLDAYICLGYIWYYGRTGVKDYEKAFFYYSKAMKAGDLISTYKVADMYKNGYYVEKDYEKYKEIIESLYPKVKKARNLGAPLPEVFTRLARIRAAEGKREEAVELNLKAKDFLAQRISYNDFFGNLSIMKWLIDDLYTLIPFDYEQFDFYDLFYLLLRPGTVSFTFEGDPYEVHAVEENGEVVIEFNGKWFRNREDFFAKAQIGEGKLTFLYDALEDLAWKGET